MKDREVGEPEVLEKFGVTPDKVIDIQALAGDSVDNVPGVPGIGVKTAAQLITEYGDLETLLARAPEIKQQKRRENLIEFAEQARISKKLVTLDEHVPLDHDVSGFAVDNPRASQLIGFTKALEFTSFTRKIAGELDSDSTAIDPIPVEVKFWPPEGGEAAALPPPRFAAKKRFSTAPHSVANTPPMKSMRWFCPGIWNKFRRLPTAPTRGSQAPNTTRSTRACSMAAAHMAQGSSVT